MHKIFKVSYLYQLKKKKRTIKVAQRGGKENMGEK